MEKIKLQEKINFHEKYQKCKCNILRKYQKLKAIQHKICKVSQI